MKESVHLVMPMAGHGSRFGKAGFDVPKPLIPLYGKPFFYWAVRSVTAFTKPLSLRFVVLAEHIEQYGIDRAIRREFPEAEITALPEVTEGAVVTCMEGTRTITDEHPVVFNDCDHLFKSTAFIRLCGEAPASDGVLLTFRARENKYSFVEKNEAGAVIRTAEKIAISDEAICGCYYFRNTALFRANAEQYLMHCNYSEYYMSGVYNTVIENGGSVVSVPTDWHVPFGVPEEYELAKKDLHPGVRPHCKGVKCG